MTDDNDTRRHPSDTPSALSSEALMMPMMERMQEQTETALVLAAQRNDEALAATRKYYDAVLAEREARYQGQFANQKEAVAVALAAAEKETRAAFDSAEKAIAAAAASSKEAILKSEIAQAELNKATYVSIRGLEEKFVALMPRDEAVIRFDNQSKEIQELRDRFNTARGEKAGGLDMRAALIAVAGLILTLLTIATIVLAR